MHPYQSALHDRIIYKWRHCLPGGQNRTKKLSQPFEEQQGSNLEFKLITPKSITGTYFETTHRFSLAGLPMAAILDF